MKKLLLAFVLVFTSLVFAIEPQTPPGSGTESNPYQISKCEHLLWIGNPANENKVYAVLTADVDCIALTNLVLEDNLKFYGSLDGQGHTLFNTVGYFHYYDEEYEYDDYYYDGLFDFYGELRNVTFKGTCDDCDYCCFADDFEGTADNVKLFYADLANCIKSSSVSNTVVYNGSLAYYSISDSSIQMVQINRGALAYIEGTSRCTIQNVELNHSTLTPYDSESFIENIKANDSPCLIQSAYETVLSKAQISGVIYDYLYPYYYLSDIGGCIGTASSCVISNVAVIVNTYYYFYDSYWENVGGIIGRDVDSSSKIINSYFGGYIDSDIYYSDINAGGIVGYGSTSAENCYYQYGYYFNNDVGTAVNYDGLYYQSTFEGWDFDNVWTMEDWSMPQLRLELSFSENKPQIPPGKGTEDEPYEISQYEHLLWLRGQDNSWIYAVLTADIDASASSADLFASSPYFYGNIDGQGHTIYDLIGNYFDWEEYIGGYLSFVGSIYNLNFVWNTTNGVFASDFCGYAENISVTNGRFADEIDEGSLKKISITNGSLADCIDYGWIDNVNITDGYLASECEDSSIKNVEINNGILTFSAEDSSIFNVVAHNSPFIVSDADYSSINFVTIDGEINSSDPRFSEYECIGGCVCYSYQSVIANAAVNVNITHNTDSNDDWDCVGGIVGYDGGRSLIYDSYYAGKITGSVSYGMGGILGYGDDSPEIHSCYFDKDKAPDNGYGCGVSNADLMKKATFEDWDFERVWTIDEGKSYPQLMGQTQSQTPPGSGTQDDPYQVSKFEHLLWLGENYSYDYDEEVFNNYFYAVLTADIYAGTLWASSGEDGDSSGLVFSGKLDGQGHTIYDLNAYSMYFDYNEDGWYWEDYYSGFFYFGGGELCNINFVGKNTFCRFASDFYDGIAKNIKINNGCLASWYFGGSQADNIEINGGFFSHGLFLSTVKNTKVNNGFLTTWAENSLLDQVSIDGKINSNDPEWGSNIGGCAGYARECTIQNVAVNVDITREGSTNDYWYEIGGIVGFAYENVIISNSFYTGKITGKAEGGCGGIIGATVTTNQYYPTSTNQYGYAAATVVNCYFDRAKAPANGFGTGVSSVDLMMKSTFENWDFEEIWTIAEGISYPQLRCMRSVIVCNGTSKTGISVKGVLTDEDLKAIQDNPEVCLNLLSGEMMIASQYELSESKSQKFSYKNKEEGVNISYKGKNKTLKFKSASPLVTLGKKIDGAFSPCELTDTKMKVNTTAKLTDDISELLKEPLKVSLADTELSGNAMGGTAVKLNSSAKKISYKGTEGNVKLSVKINIAKKKVAVKYTGKDTVMPALCREPKTE